MPSLYYVDFLSSYRGVSDYSVHVPEIGYSIRVHRNQDTDELTVPAHSLSPAIAQKVAESVRHFLSVEHDKFLAWCADKGLDPLDCTARR